MATAKGPPATVEPRSAEGDNLLASYLQDISESTPLSSPQEADLARRIRRRLQAVSGAGSDVGGVD